MQTIASKTDHLVHTSARNTAARVPFFQPKLTINTPGDPFEQEADAIADQVMRMPVHQGSFISLKPLPVSTILRKCAHCEEEEKMQRKEQDEEDQMLQKKSLPGFLIQRKCAHCEEEEKQMHRKENSSEPVDASSMVSSYIQSLSSKGSPLPNDSRNFFESRFGYDFSDVKIHNDADAAQSSQSVNALAYTVGNNIVFNQNQFSPNSDGGKKLLAHELTHVVQQKNSKTAVQCARGSEGTCPGKYEPDEQQQSYSQKGVLPDDVFITGTNDLVIADFGVGDRHSKSSVKSNYTLKSWLKKFELEEFDDLKITGYSDCVGLEKNNEYLRTTRAKFIVDLFGPKARKKIKSNEGAPLGDYLELNDTKDGRAMNRSIVIHFFDKVIYNPHPFSPDRRHEESDKRELKEYKERYDLTPFDTKFFDERVIMDKQILCIWKMLGCDRLKSKGYPEQDYVNPWDEECRKHTKYNGPVINAYDIHCEGAGDFSVEIPDLPYKNNASQSIAAWLFNNRHEILAAEQHWKIDRRAIAGAIAWEVIKNPKAFGLRFVGPGKIHVREESFGSTEGTIVAKQVEDMGYLPRRASEERIEILKTPKGSITYIAVIMRAYADAAQKAGYDINCTPEILVTFYQGVGAASDLNKAVKYFQTKQYPEKLLPNDEMGKWVSENLSYLEGVVGKPKLFGCSNETKPQRKAKNNSNINQSTNSIEYYISRLSSGDSLNKASKIFFESRMGYDFSDVHIHTNNEAAQSAKNINALAYTHGNNIVFGENQYRPETNEGKKLLAHELTHVIQQKNFCQTFISRQLGENADEAQPQLLDITTQAAVYFEPLKVSLIFAVVQDDIENGLIKKDIINDAFWTAFRNMDSKQINEENVPDVNERKFYTEAYLFIQNSIYPYIAQQVKGKAREIGSVATPDKTTTASTTSAAKSSSSPQTGSGITGQALGLNGAKFYIQYETELKSNFGSLASKEEIKYVVAQVMDKKNFEADYNDNYDIRKIPLTQGVYILRHNANNYIPDKPLITYGKLKDKWEQYGVTDEIWVELNDIKQKLIYPMLRFIVPRITSMEQLSNDTDVGNRVAQQSYNYLGIKYVKGGQLSSQDKYGIDCSGLVFQVYRDIGIKPKYGSGNGVDMLRTSQNFEVIDATNILPGDLLLRSKKGEGWKHVGIYVGNNYLVEAPYTGTVVQKSAYKADKWQLVIRYKP